MNKPKPSIVLVCNIYRHFRNVRLIYANEYWRLHLISLKMNWFHSLKLCFFSNQIGNIKRPFFQKYIHNEIFVKDEIFYSHIYTAKKNVTFKFKLLFLEKNKMKKKTCCQLKSSKNRLSPEMCRYSSIAITWKRIEFLVGCRASLSSHHFFSFRSFSLRLVNHI